VPGSAVLLSAALSVPRLEGNDNAVRADVSDHIQAISLDLGVPERHSHCGEPAPSARTRLRPLSLPIEGVAAAMPEAAHLSHNRQYEHSQARQNHELKVNIRRSSVSPTAERVTVRDRRWSTAGAQDPPL
jgi:hypothetical protein